MLVHGLIPQLVPDLFRRPLEDGEGCAAAPSAPGAGAGAGAGRCWRRCWRETKLFKHITHYIFINMTSSTKFKADPL